MGKIRRAAMTVMVCFVITLMGCNGTKADPDIMSGAETVDDSHVSDNVADFDFEESDISGNTAVSDNSLASDDTDMQESETAGDEDIIYLLGLDESSIAGEIVRGDFSHLTNDSDGYYEERYNRINQIGEGFAEWRLIDLNGDGIDDLILQQADENYYHHHQIIGIFACGEDSAKCVDWDEVDMTEYFCCTPTGELMYVAWNYGPMISNELYRHYYYDPDWNRITDYYLEILRVELEDSEYPEYAQEWREDHPDMPEDGYYFIRGTDDERELMTLDEFTKIYESLTGLKLESDFYFD